MFVQNRTSSSMSKPVFEFLFLFAVRVRSFVLFLLRAASTAAKETTPITARTRVSFIMFERIR